MDDPQQGSTLAEILLLLLMLSPVILLSAIFKKEQDEREAEWKKEEERKAKVKALYPEPPSYEERMGVKYGPDVQQDEEE